LKTADNIYDLVSEYLQVKEGSISILDEKIDNGTQLEYFECSKNNENLLTDDEIISRKDLIFDDAISTDEKKVLLVQLATISKVEAYRTIEKYLQSPNINLYQWAYLALLENRMLLESTLLEENKVLITTGLGSKGNKLRYFIVFFTGDGSYFTSLQQKIILNEMNFAFNRNGAEIEDAVFQEGFASFTTVVPMQVPVQNLFYKIIKECNEFGSFLFNDYIITNHKVLCLEEIRELLALNNII
jgi:hypothetical protein